MNKDNSSTSWQSVSKWYDDSVGSEGHYYHKQIILPNLHKIFDFAHCADASLLDVGCGQGVFSRTLPEHVAYHGIDVSKSLIQSAKKQRLFLSHQFSLVDATKPFQLEKTDFSHALILLALQNMEDPRQVIMNVKNHLRKNGTLVIVLNHPCFRIPRQSSWQIDTANKIQYRRINRYLCPLKIPLHMHPGKGKDSEVTWSFHFPLSFYSSILKEAGFAIVSIEEWVSDKQSEGKHAAMENRCRKEFPLFLSLQCLYL